MNPETFQFDSAVTECLRTRANFRRQLLTTASAVVLAATLACSAAKADSGGNPNDRWTFELGGGPQFYSGGDVTWFESSNVPPQGIRPKTGWDVTGKATFEPADSPWIFSLAAQYGRSASKHKGGFHATTVEYSGTNFLTGKASHREDHVVVDFEVGQDIGLGMFGTTGSSVISGGLRYAHFEANTSVNLTAFYTGTYGSSTHFTQLKEKRTFSGVGPIISWDASTPFLSSDGPLSLDWGADFAVLFGKHSAKVELFYTGAPFSTATRHKGVAVPSFDAYAALSYHFCDCGASASVGYKIDSFFDVLDGGGLEGDTKIDRTFQGPFLSVKFDTGG